MCKYVADDYNYKVVYDDDNDDNGIWKYLIKKITNCFSNNKTYRPLYIELG